MRDRKVMRKIDRRYSILLIGLLIYLVIGQSTTVWAADAGPDDTEEIQVDLSYYNEEYKTTLIVYDREGLFSDSEIRSFIESASEVMIYSNVCVVTAAERDYESFAKETLYDYFGRGSNSTVFLINMSPRRIYIYSDGQTYQVITNDAALTITDNVYRQASQGAYYACVDKALRQEATLLSGGHILEPMKYIGNFFLAFAVAILLAFGLTFWLRPKMKKEAIAGIDQAVLAALAAGIVFSFVNEERIYDPVKSDDSGGGGGGFSGGGDSGGGGGHSF